MPSDTQNEGGLTESEDREDLPQAKVIPSDNFRDPEVKPWLYANLERQEQQAEEKIRDDVLEKLRKEVEPQVREQATLIKRQAFEEAQKQGYDEGFQQGVKAGRLEGKSQAQKEAEERLVPQVKSLQDLAEFMCSPYQRISEQVFAQLAGLSLEIAKKIVQKELDQHHDWVLNAVKKSVEILPNEVEPIEVHLNPADKEIVETYAKDARTNWVLISDERIPSGSCKIKQNASTLVNDWREQLDGLIEDAYAVADKLAEPEDDISSENNFLSTAEATSMKTEQTDDFSSKRQSVKPSKTPADNASS